jgi:hypothetical protein
MGQQIAVTAKPSSTPGVLRFEANRNLTGMGHELFRSVGDAVGPRPAAKLAREILATGTVDAVHLFGNIITVDLAKGFDGRGLDELVRDLYQYWKPGMEPPVFDAAAAQAPAAATSGDAPAVAGGDSEYLRRVPTTLVERSQAALAKWRAAH